MQRFLTATFFSFLLALSNIALAAQQAEPPGSIIIKQVVAIRSVGRAGRSPIHQDAVEARIVAGSWTPPSAGDKVALPDGTFQTWQLLQADKNNLFTGAALNGGYAYARIDSGSNKTMILEASGHTMVYVNGEPRVGDPYEYGYVHIPVHIHSGQNHLLFLCGRGRLRARLAPPKAPLFLDSSDLTAPDLVVGAPGPSFAGIVVTN